MKRIKKSCSGCADHFIAYQKNNYDYCRNCAIMAAVQNQCPEWGDGSGWIKFPNQNCKCKIFALVQPKIPFFYGC
ncbi:hypothetical protein [endosymbiont GvMRE of Glomus versiforme]|uniref:hypothetical protein n=1 Tax=endosymbiont GvMRE of Glomus versiforme TaxID=2039283 RepID=UPI001558C84D|nr:hypothetical protein [endosymbiont GvMRE of Glomus versiforme]